MNICTLCEKRRVDHLGPEEFCTTQGRNRFSQEAWVPREAVKNIMAGMLAGARMLRGDIQHINLAEFDAQADRAIEMALAERPWQ